MVSSSCILCCSKAVKHTAKRIRRKFIDSLRFHITAGAGGMGYPKFGGTGGAGGSVYAVGKEGVSLRNLLTKFPEKRVKAPMGENSHSRCIVGQPGQDFIIETPFGVTIYNESGKKLGDIDNEDDKVLVAKGGLGGCSETGFSGLKGEKGVFIFDLKLIADVGLVGFPNAGKSTLLSIISKAKPRIASYPFTTLHPQLGIIQYPDHRKISVADLPGLIEGAHANIGLGHKFLKHVERTKVLTVVVDVGGFQLSPKHKPRSCIETIILLNKELELYREDLVHIPSILVVNKMDKPEAEDIFKETCSVINNLEHVFHEVPEEYRPNQPLRFEKVLSMSAVKNDPEEIDRVRSSLRELMDSYIDSEISEKEKELLEEIERRYKEHGPKLL